MQKNTASQQFVVFAFDATTNIPKTGDAANITATISKDFAADVATDDVNPTETQKGFYVFDALQAETNADDIQIFPSSTTSNIQVISVPGVITTVPVTFADDIIQTGDSYLGATAQANLEAMYDGTGYIADSAPASRAQVDGIGAASGAAFPIEATEDNFTSPIKGISKVGTQTGTFTDTDANNGIYHVLTHVGNDIDWIYGFDVGGSRTAVSVDARLFLNSNNDAMFMQAYNFVATTWETIRPIPGQNGSTDIPLIPGLLQRHTGTGADLGKVYLRFVADGTMTSPVLNIDLLHVLATNIGNSVGYALGRIWTKTDGGTAGVEPYTNGVADKPSLLWVDTITLSDALDLTDFHILNGSTIQLSANSDHYSLFGNNWVLQLNAKSVDGAHFEGGIVSGVGTSATGVSYMNFIVGTMSVQLGTFDFCSFNGTVTMTLAGDYNYHNCKSKVAGVGGPTFTKTAGQVITAQWRDWAGSLTLSGIQTSDVFTISGEELGDIILNGVDGTVKILGQTESVTDNRTGSPILIRGDFVGSDVSAIKTDTAATLADTNDLQTNQGDWLTATGFNTVVPPSVTQFNARTLVSDDYFIVTDYTAPDNAGISDNGTEIGLLNNISVAQIFAGGDIDTYSLEESLKLISSACLGIVSGAATSTMIFKAIDGSKTRLTATTDIDGNRIAVSKDATG